MGGKRQRRLQKTKGAREAEKLSVDEVKSIAESFLGVKILSELCSLLELTPEDVVEIYNPKYKSFEIKRNGKKRTILSPAPRLLWIQERLTLLLNYTYKDFTSAAENPAYAYIPAIKKDKDDIQIDKSIVSNAQRHVGKAIVVNLDIENFFPTISKERVLILFQNNPFNFSFDLANFLAHIVTFNNNLPIGASTSPILSNFVAIDLDDQLKTIPNVTYTRYSDDLTFSSNYYDKAQSGKLVLQIIKIVEANGFKINYEKLKISGSEIRQEVTGVVVNKKTNVRRTYVREIRAILFSIEKNGWEKAAETYVNKNKSKFLNSVKGYFRSAADYNLSDTVVEKYLWHPCKLWYFNKSLRAKIEHIGYVKGKKDIIYNNLKKKLLILQGKRVFLMEVNLADHPEIAYTTNAVANSVVFYAYMFLKHSGYSDVEISELRKNFSVQGSGISKEKILESFKNQSAYFMNLYAYITQHDRFETFVTDINGKNKFKRIFKYYDTPFALMRQFNRKIYHANFDCEFIRSDYHEIDGDHMNTGVYSEEILSNNSKLYLVTRDFAEKLGMRVCKICG